MPKKHNRVSDSEQQQAPIEDSQSTNSQEPQFSDNDYMDHDEMMKRTSQKLSIDVATLKKAMQPNYRSLIMLHATSSERIHNLIKENAVAASRSLKEQRKAKKRRGKGSPDEGEVEIPSVTQQAEMKQDTDINDQEVQIEKEKRKSRPSMIKSNVIEPLQKGIQVESAQRRKSIQVSESPRTSRLILAMEEDSPTPSLASSEHILQPQPSAVGADPEAVPQVPFFMSDRSDIKNKLSMERKRNLESKLLRKISLLDTIEAKDRLRRLTYMSRVASLGTAEEYDPFEHRKIHNVMTNFESVAHLIRSTLALGILRMPYAFMHVGFYQGVIGTLLLISLVNFCIKMLLHAKYEICKKLRLPFVSFGDAVKQSFEMGPRPLKAVSRWSAYFADSMIVFCQLSRLTAYVTYISGNGITVFEGLCRRTINPPIALLICIAPTVMILFIRDLKRLAVLSIFANLLACGLLVILLGSLIDDLPELNVATANTVHDYYIFIGLVLSNWNPIAPALAVECHMKNPAAFFGYFGAFSMSMTFSVIFFILLGFFGFWKYGNDTDYNIMLNMQLSDDGRMFTLIAHSVVMYISIALQAFLPLEIIWESYMVRYLKGSRHQSAWEYFLIITFATIPFVVSCSPRYVRTTLMSFSIALLPIVQMFYPALIDFCLKWQLLKTSVKLQCCAARDVLIMILSIVACASATYVYYIEVY